MLLTLIRKTKHLSQEQAALELSVDRSTIAKWESGAAYPATAKLPVLELFYGISATEIIEAITAAKSGAKEKPAT